MIEAKVAGEPNTSTNEKPQTITMSMIIEDLDNGIDREGIRTKYNLAKWEVTEMFKHPSLKGKKAKKKKALSFNFVDDTQTDSNQTSIPMPEEDYNEDDHNDEETRKAEREMEHSAELNTLGISQDEYENGDEYDEGDQCSNGDSSDEKEDLMDETKEW